MRAMAAAAGPMHADAFGGGLQHAAERGAAREGFFFVAALNNDVGQRGEGRVVEGAAEVDFFFVEGLVVLGGGASDGVVIGIDGLDQYDSGSFAAAGASAGLGQ